MNQLIGMDEAKDHLHITNDDADFDIDAKLSEASAIVLMLAKFDAVPAEWLTGSPVVIVAPYRFKTAVKLVLSDLYYNRESGISQAITETVIFLVGRAPTIA